MGLIKTGLVLAGGYGLIKAASNQQHQPGHDQKMGYLYQNQMSNIDPRSQSRAVVPQTKDGRGAPPPYYQHGSAQEYYFGRSN
ncbi:hypothetical protein N7523_003824 [Penicillium sp. IBT 18751x]|nr:hypothetical protein N7523_003824 [Penicillium sp. IBT 18751x]